MDAENSAAVDLLGDPWSELPDPRGRKRHKRTVQVAEKVAVLRGSGLTPPQIAARVALSEPTLRKYYFRELEEGAVLAQAVLTEAMWDKARSGNVGAAKYIRDAFAKGQAAIPVAKKPASPKPEKLGKKAAAGADARTAHEGTGWGELLSPAAKH